MKYINEDRFRNTTLFKRMMFLLIYSNNWTIRFVLARRGYYLDKLINDENVNVRIMARATKNIKYQQE